MGLVPPSTLGWPPSCPLAHPRRRHADPGRSGARHRGGGRRRARAAPTGGGARSRCSPRPALAVLTLATLANRASTRCSSRWSRAAPPRAASRCWRSRGSCTAGPSTLPLLAVGRAAVPRAGLDRRLGGEPAAAAVRGDRGRHARVRVARAAPGAARAPSASAAAPARVGVRRRARALRAAGDLLDRRRAGDQERLPLLRAVRAAVPAAARGDLERRGCCAGAWRSRSASRSCSPRSAASSSPPATC